MSKVFKIVFYPFNLLFILLVKLYKWCISPLLPHTCIYYPTCSTYMIKALKEYGIINGLWLGIKRLIKCSPKHKGGFDPLPQNIKGDSKWII